MRSTQERNESSSLSFYFQVHQPRRIRHLGFFDIGKELSYFDDELNGRIMRHVAKNCYEPANQMFLRLIKKFPQTRLTFSLSGVALEELKQYAPAVVESFRALAATGCVEFLGETYYHSLAGLYDSQEFVRQVELHRQAMKDTLGVNPIVFRNTELIYSDEIGWLVRNLGFAGIYADGVEKILGRRSADHVYRHADDDDLRLFLRNYSLSDDIAFRFSDRGWKEWPLTPEKFTGWLEKNPSADRLINLGLDYETFGEHQKAATGIFTFMKKVVASVARSRRLRMVTPSEAMQVLPATDKLSVPVPVSWADKERDLSAWLGNDLQRDAFDTMRSLVTKATENGDSQALHSLCYLQTSDHFYYMSTKHGDDGRIHNYFSPYRSPYVAFIHYMNVLTDISLRLKKRRKVEIMRKREVLKRASLREAITQ
ncbi:MAG TPA: glycoside hydrolase family 57 protein [Chryseosolibacter sp.]